MKTDLDQARRHAAAPAGAPEHANDGAPTLSRFFRSVFASWHGNEVQFVVLRNYESLPDAMGNDVDILVDDMETAGRVLIECARRAGYRLCHHVAFGSHSFYFTDASLGKPIRIDLMTRIDWYGFLILDADDILSNSRERASFRIPHPIHEAIIKLLLRLLYQGYVKEKYRAFIRDAFVADRGHAVSALRRTFGPRVARRVVDAAVFEAWGEIESWRFRLRAAIVLHNCLFHPWATFALWLGDSTRRVRRMLHPAGVSVALLGPDGSGKSAVARALLESADLPLYRSYGRCIHWKPEVIPRLRDKDWSPAATVAPHARPPRNPLASGAYFLVHVTEFLIGAPVRIWPTLYANGLVILDRYFYDFFVDPARYRLRLPAAVVELGCRLLRPADLVFVLDAPAATLLGRKAEVPAQEAERQRTAYRRLRDRLPNATVVDASQPFERVVDDIRRRLMEYLSVRVAHRVRRAGSL